MKHSSIRALKRHDSRELNWTYFIHFASLLTLGAMIVVLPALVCQGSPEIWIAAGPLCIFTIAFIWTVTLSIGWFVITAVAVLRISRRLGQAARENFDHRGQVWDRWMDGPEAMVP